MPLTLLRGILDSLCALYVLKWSSRKVVINLTLYFKRGQCIELSPQEEAEAWPESASWHGYSPWQRKPLSDCRRVCRFCQDQAGREI